MPRDTSTPPPGPTHESSESDLGTRSPAAVEAALDEYEALVGLWAPRLDLVAPGDLDRFRERHVVDALRLQRLLDELPAGPAVDVGSGAGLPGIPLAIARPERHWRLLEPRRRRAAFLEEVVRSLGLDAEVLAITAQAAAADPELARNHALATARALAPPTAALGLISPLVSPGGAAAIYLGKSARIPQGADQWGPGIAIMTIT